MLLLLARTPKDRVLVGLYIQHLTRDYFQIICLNKMGGIHSTDSNKALEKIMLFYTDKKEGRNLTAVAHCCDYWGQESRRFLSNRQAGLLEGLLLHTRRSPNSLILILPSLM